MEKKQISDLKSELERSRVKAIWLKEEIRLRDSFAGNALNGIMSDSWMFNYTIEAGQEMGLDASESIAKMSYDISDAMLKQRTLKSKTDE